MDIAELLNINQRDLRDFPLRANLVQNEQNKRVVDRHKTILKRIENDHLQSGIGLKIPQASIDNVINQIKESSNSGRDINLSFKDLRILSYNLSQLTDHSTGFSLALNILNSNWRNLFFNGLVYFIMGSWADGNQLQIKSAISLFTSKLKAYSDNNRRYLKFKDHLNFFEENGPLRMCALLKAKEIPLEEAPTLLYMSKSSFNQSYYDDVIINFFKQETKPNLDYIEDILIKHNTIKSKKIVLANLVINANRSENDNRQIEIGNIATRILGDISLPTTWAPFSSATTDEIALLRRAYEIVAVWYARQVIQCFFDICVQDINRKSFWLQYTKELYDFRIVGSSSVRSLLSSDGRIKQQLRRIFIETNSVKNQTAALVMYIRDKVIIEFSDVGSLYVYLPNHRTVKNLQKRKTIDSINDLKDTSLLKLIEQDYYYNEYRDFGIMRHAGSWQERLHKWMRNKVLLMPNGYKKEIDEIFYSHSNNKVDKETETKAHSAIQKYPDYNTPQQRSLFDSITENQTPASNESPNHEESQNVTKLKSKYFFNGQYCVILTKGNLILFKYRNSHTVKLCRILFEVKKNGSIWIKKPRIDGYQQIVYVCDDKYTPLGSIKLDKDLIIFKDAIFSSITQYKTSEI